MTDERNLREPIASRPFPGAARPSQDRGRSVAREVEISRGRGGARCDLFDRRSVREGRHPRNEQRQGEKGTLAPGKRATGKFSIPPGIESFPQCLMAEAVGQLAAWVAMSHIGFRGRPVAALATETRFARTANPGEELDLEGLAAAYAVPGGSWLRCNMVTTLDGAANGPDNRSGSINTEADHVVFELLRALSDAVIVGAGTIRVEGYSAIAVSPELRPIRERAGLADALPLITVSRAGFLPPTLSGAPHGDVLLATSASAPGITAARSVLGDDQVLVCGEDDVDLGDLLGQLHARGWTRLLTEGGPRLTASFLASGLLDELCFTIAPRLVGGDHPRPVGSDAAPLDLDLELAVLVEEAGTLMGRWLTRR